MGIFKKQNSSNFLRHFYVVDSYPSEREQYRLAIFRETRLLWPLILKNMIGEIL